MSSLSQYRLDELPDMCLESVLHWKAMDSRAGCAGGMSREEAFFVMFVLPLLT